MMSLVIARIVPKSAKRLLITNLLRLNLHHKSLSNIVEVKTNRLPCISSIQPFLIQRENHFSTTSNKNSEDQNVVEKLSIFQKFKKMYRDYWYVLVPVHLATSTIWLGGFYYIACSGVDIPALLESLHFSDKLVKSMQNSSMGYVAITYGLYKIATPIRYTVTLGGTTISINYLKKWGYIKPKPIPTTERLKAIYAETKVGMKEKKEHLVTSVKESKKNIKEKVIRRTTGSSTSSNGTDKPQHK